MSLFATTPSETHLVEFNAGKCIVEGSWIKPDTRKGKIYMDQGDDQFLHFCWKERKNQAVNEDDFIIFPDEAEFSLVSQCTTGRVYILKFKTSNECHFYWMQNANAEKDEDIVERVNKLIRDPDSNMNTYSEMDESSSHAEFMRLLSSVESQDLNITQENLYQFLQNIGGSSGLAMSETEERSDDNTSPVESTPPTIATSTPDTTSATTHTPTPATTHTTTSANVTTDTPMSDAQVTPEQYEQFRQMLANIRTEGPTSISLNDVLTPQALNTLLQDKNVCESLYAYLPEESDRNLEEVQQVVKSPQFRQSLQSLTVALQTGQLGPLLSQLGLNPSAGNSVEAFLNAIMDQAKEKEDPMEE